MSVDVFLGLPFNIASYALLLHIIAQLTGYEPRYLTFVGGDVHIYNNHVEQCETMIARPPRVKPVLLFPSFDSLDDYIYNCSIDEFILEGYDPHPTIKAPMAV